MEDHIAPERIIAFVDRCLAGDEAEAVRLHLDSCPECADAATILQRLDERVRRAAPGEEQLPEVELPEDLELALKKTDMALLRDLAAGKERVRTRSPVLEWLSWLCSPKPALVTAAALLVLVGFLTWPDAVRVEFERQVPDSLRGGEKDRFYLNINWPYGGYLYILDLDKDGEVSFIYPYLSEEGLEDFGIKGPFEKGRRIQIPSSSGPERYEGFALAGDWLFLIPSPSAVTADDLRTMIRSLDGEFPVGAVSAEDRANKTLEWLKEKYPGTAVRRHEVAPRE